MKPLQGVWRKRAQGGARKRWKKKPLHPRKAKTLHSLPIQEIRNMIESIRDDSPSPFTVDEIMLAINALLVSTRSGRVKGNTRTIAASNELCGHPCNDYLEGLSLPLHQTNHHSTMKLTDSIRKKIAQDFGRLGGLKARNQKEAAAKSHTRAAEAKRRATRAARRLVGSSTDNGKS